MFELSHTFHLMWLDMHARCSRCTSVRMLCIVWWRLFRAQNARSRCIRWKSMNATLRFAHAMWWQRMSEWWTSNAQIAAISFICVRIRGRSFVRLPSQRESNMYGCVCVLCCVSTVCSRVHQHHRRPFVATAEHMKNSSHWDWVVVAGCIEAGMTEALRWRHFNYHIMACISLLVFVYHIWSPRAPQRLGRQSEQDAVKEIEKKQNGTMTRCNYVDEFYRRAPHMSFDRMQNDPVLRCRIGVGFAFAHADAMQKYFYSLRCTKCIRFAYYRYIWLCHWLWRWATNTPANRCVPFYHHPIIQTWHLCKCNERVQIVRAR